MNDCTGHLGTCPTPLELAIRRAESAEAEVAALRAVVAVVEDLIAKAEQGAGTWGTCSHEWLSINRLRGALDGA